MCFKRSPKYDWSITLTVNNNDDAYKLDNISRNAFNNNLFHGSVKEANKFCLYLLKECPSITKISTRNEFVVDQPTFLIEIIRMDSKEE